MKIEPEVNFKYIGATIIVMTIKFYDRENELKLLKKVKKPYLAIIYGRRRIGKTSLALNFVKNGSVNLLLVIFK